MQFWYHLYRRRLPEECESGEGRDMRVLLPRQPQSSLPIEDSRTGTPHDVIHESPRRTSVERVRCTLVNAFPTFPPAGASLKE